jgi:hypothetical protein
MELTADKGAIATEDGHLVIRDTAGTPVDKRPLHFFVDDRSYPITAVVKAAVRG